MENKESENEESENEESENDETENEHLLPGEAYELINPGLKTLLSIFESSAVTRSDVKELKRS
jgi:hypothetical protein